MRHLRLSTLTEQQKRTDLWAAEQRAIAVAVEVTNRNSDEAAVSSSSNEVIPKREEDGYESCLSSLFTDYNQISGVDKFIRDFDFEPAMREQEWADSTTAPHLHEDETDLSSWCVEELKINEVFFPAIKLKRKIKKDEGETTLGNYQKPIQRAIALPTPRQQKKQKVSMVATWVPMPVDDEDVIEVMPSSPYSVKTPPVTPRLTPAKPKACAGGRMEYVEGMCSTSFILNDVKLQRKAARGKKVRFTCPMPNCQKVYLTRNGMSYHASNHHKEKRINVFECEKCRKVLITEKGFITHVTVDSCKRRKRLLDSLPKGPQDSARHRRHIRSRRIAQDLPVRVKAEPIASLGVATTCSPQISNWLANVKTEPIDVVFKHSEVDDVSSPSVTLAQQTPLIIVPPSFDLSKVKIEPGLVSRIILGQQTLLGVSEIKKEPEVNVPIDSTRLGEWFGIGDAPTQRRLLFSNEVQPNYYQTGPGPIVVKTEPGLNAVRKVETQELRSFPVREIVPYQTTLSVIPVRKPADFFYAQPHQTFRNQQNSTPVWNLFTPPSSYTFADPMQVLNDHSYTSFSMDSRRRHFGLKNLSFDPMKNWCTYPQ